MDKNDILDYVTKTPGNTNRAVLGSMLDSLNSGGEKAEYIQRIIAVTKDDIVACADENNVVNEWDLIEYVIRKHIGNVNCADGSGYYLISANFTSNGSPSLIVEQIAQYGVYFMGGGSEMVTNVQMGYNIIFVSDGVYDHLSKNTEPASTSTITINEVTYSLIAITGTKRSFIGG